MQACMQHGLGLKPIHANICKHNLQTASCSTRPGPLLRSALAKHMHPNSDHTFSNKLHSTSKSVPGKFIHFFRELLRLPPFLQVGEGSKHAACFPRYILEQMRWVDVVYIHHATSIIILSPFPHCSAGKWRIDEETAGNHANLISARPGSMPNEPILEAFRSLCIAMSEEVTACGGCCRACAVAPDVHHGSSHHKTQKSATQKHPDPCYAFDAWAPNSVVFSRIS